MSDRDQISDCDEVSDRDEMSDRDKMSAQTNTPQDAQSPNASVSLLTRYFVEKSRGLLLEVRQSLQCCDMP